MPEETVVEEMEMPTQAVEEPAPPEPVQEEGTEARIVQLEGALAHKAERLSALEAALQEVRTALDEREAVLATLREQLSITTDKYRSALLASAPEVPEELVHGNTLEELEAAMERARQVVEEIRSRLEAQTAGQRIPAGAPARTGPDLSVLSAQEKIAYALGQRS